MQHIDAGDVITFTEYEITQLTGRRRIRQRMENMTVADVIIPGEAMTSEQIEQYFGEDLEPVIRAQLSRSGATRLMLQSDDNEYHCVELSDDFLRNGLQEIEIGQRAQPNPAEAPSYLQFLDAFGA